jgi:hypothetical protein
MGVPTEQDFDCVSEQDLLPFMSSIEARRGLACRTGILNVFVFFTAMTS